MRVFLSHPNPLFFILVPRTSIELLLGAQKKGCLCWPCFRAGVHSSPKAWLKVCEPSGQSHWPQWPYTAQSHGQAWALTVTFHWVGPAPWYPSATVGSTIISTVIQSVLVCVCARVSPGPFPGPSRVNRGFVSMCRVAWCRLNQYQQPTGQLWTMNKCNVRTLNLMFQST